MIEMLDYGNKHQIRGILFGINEKEGNHIVMMPGESLDLPNIEDVHYYASHVWERLIRQTDILEVEVTDPKDNTKKILARKSQRQIDQHIAWSVYKRDHYKCRYCGNDDAPLTVDHVITWESGGPTEKNNLVSACKKCNRTRSNMSFSDWLNSGYYKEVSKGISENVFEANLKLLVNLDEITIVKNKRSR